MTLPEVAPEPGHGITTSRTARGRRCGGARAWPGWSWSLLVVVAGVAGAAARAVRARPSRSPAPTWSGPAPRTGWAPTRSTATSSPGCSTASGSTCSSSSWPCRSARPSACWSGWSSTMYGFADVVAQRVFDVMLAFPVLILGDRAHGRSWGRASRTIAVVIVPPSSRVRPAGAHLGAHHPRAAVRRGVPRDRRRQRLAAAQAPAAELAGAAHRPAGHLDVGRGLHRGRDELPRAGRPAAQPVPGIPDQGRHPQHLGEPVLRRRPPGRRGDAGPRLPAHLASRCRRHAVPEPPHPWKDPNDDRSRSSRSGPRRSTSRSPGRP